MLSSLSEVLAHRALRLYPGAWQRPYAEEVAAVLERGVGCRDVLDRWRGAIDAWLLDLRTGTGGRMTTAKVIVAYVALQLAAFAALRSFAGPGRIDVAAWALAYGVGYVVLGYALARRPRGDAAA